MGVSTKNATDKRWRLGGTVPVMCERGEGERLTGQFLSMLFRISMATARTMINPLMTYCNSGVSPI